MRQHILSMLAVAFASVSLFTAPALAQQKTVKACQEEWRANKAANQSAGITEKAYVEKCRAGAVATTAPQAPAAARPAPASPAAATAAPKKTVKACQEEWRANKAANQAAGVTEKAYVEKCRAGVAAAAPAPTPAPSPAATAKPAPAPAAAPKTTAAPSAVPAPARATAAGEFATEAQAKARCPGDTVVWVNLESKIYHYSSNRNYGHTKSGAYMCEKDTAAAGFRAAKNEKHP